MIDGHDQDSYEEWEALGDDSRVPCPIEVHTKVYLKRCTITLWVRDVRARLISGKNEPSLYEISDWIVQDC